MQTQKSTGLHTCKKSEASSTAHLTTTSSKATRDHWCRFFAFKSLQELNQLDFTFKGTPLVLFTFTRCSMRSRTEDRTFASLSTSSFSFTSRSCRSYFLFTKNPKRCSSSVFVRSTVLVTFSLSLSLFLKRCRRYASQSWFCLAIGSIRYLSSGCSTIR
jgi:hypothetical protein